MQRRLLHGIAIGTVAAALALLLDQTGIGLDSIERLSWDWRVRQLGEPSEQTDQIRLVLIDQSSLDWAETKFSVPWKWPRQFYVPVLQYLQAAGAKAVAFDMLFTESSDALDPTDDAQFGRAISNGPPFIVAMPLSPIQPSPERARSHPRRQWGVGTIRSICSSLASPWNYDSPTPISRAGEA